MGKRLDDIVTPKQNEAAADYITDIVNNLTRDEDSAIHVSIAGGHKTMGYYLGYALSDPHQQKRTDQEASDCIKLASNSIGL